MAYNKTTWENSPSTSTPINAGNLNKMEEGIYQNSIGVENNENNIGDLTELITPVKTNIVNSINSVYGTKLWENPNPSSSFSGNITLSSDDYDTLEFYFHKGTDDENSIHVVKVIKGYGGQAVISGTGVFSGTTYNSVIRRNIIYNNDTQYNISTAIYRYGNSNNYQVENILIPLYVIGYNTGLF